MSTPADYLPHSISDDSIHELLASIGLPRSIEIRLATVTSQFHTVYLITLPANNKTANNELILRVSSYHLPTIKTENEAGVMAWISSNTKTPIPQLVAYDSTADNPIAHEYTLMSRVSGQTLSDIYLSLNQN